MNLSELTTLQLGGPAGELVEASTEQQLLEALATDLPLLVVGGGSNLVVGDDGFDGRVVLVRTRGIEVLDTSDCAGVTIRVAAGEPWVDVVTRAVTEGWSGIECLAGIPGSTGATPIQNVGAYGQEVASTVAAVRTVERATGRISTFANADCGFGYRTSRFKAHADEYVVLSVDFQLALSPHSEPIRYDELAARLSVGIGDRAPLADVASAVLALRRGKGMVLDPADPDTRSAGSFFTNPVLAAEDVPAEAPAWPQPDGTVKTSAAWLIEQAGFGRGWGEGAAGISTKHTLALVNRGGATTAELLDCARAIRAGVFGKFGVLLTPEPTLVNCSL
ncbi:MAG: UDP-N-acetylmuramate dehydrogenase [Frankiales bacterium]|jgi:UDP-N-acetylmuramate dehydrogenase|nr:UDP-N-acetylmuramate dehydrogenase [Frankiales bacterium]MDX6275279.1 UDP-N-acetylmuramate dehydrogenase [Frankiales bacterium]